MHEELLPLVVRLYEKAVYRNEKTFLLGFFDYKGLKAYVPTLLRWFREPDTDVSCRWAIADRLYTINDAAYMRDYLELIADDSYGESRQMLVLLMGRKKPEEAIPILIRLLSDEKLRLHAISSLGAYRRPELRPVFEKYSHPKTRLCERVQKRPSKNFPESMQQMFCGTGKGLAW